MSSLLSKIKNKKKKMSIKTENDKLKPNLTTLHLILYI